MNLFNKTFYTDLMYDNIKSLKEIKTDEHYKFRMNNNNLEYNKEFFPFLIVLTPRRKAQIHNDFHNYNYETEADINQDIWIISMLKFLENDIIIPKEANSSIGYIESMSTNVIFNQGYFDIESTNDYKLINSLYDRLKEMSKEYSKFKIIDSEYFSRIWNYNNDLLKLRKIYNINDHLVKDTIKKIIKSEEFYHIKTVDQVIECSNSVLKINDKYGFNIIREDKNNYTCFIVNPLEDEETKKINIDEINQVNIKNLLKKNIGNIKTIEVINLMKNKTRNITKHN